MEAATILKKQLQGKWALLDHNADCHTELPRALTGRRRHVSLSN
jgi:hypothetical protein